MSRVQFHRNLNAGCWSYVPVKTLHCSQAVLIDVIVKHPTPTSKQFKVCVNGGSRKVFAWFKAATVQADKTSPIPASAERIRFNPTQGDTHFHVVRGNQKIIVNAMSKAWALNDKSGTMLGVVTSTGGVMA